MNRYLLSLFTISGTIAGSLLAVTNKPIWECAPPKGAPTELVSVDITYSDNHRDIGTQPIVFLQFYTATVITKEKQIVHFTVDQTAPKPGNDGGSTIWEGKPDSGEAFDLHISTDSPLVEGAYRGQLNTVLKATKKFVEQKIDTEVRCTKKSK